jgi:hypothetical protein
MTTQADELRIAGGRIDHHAFGYEIRSVKDGLSGVLGVVFRRPNARHGGEADT